METNVLAYFLVLQVAYDTVALFMMNLIVGIRITFSHFVGAFAALIRDGSSPEIEVTSNYEVRT